MTTVKATIKGRRLEFDVPGDWPDGTQVEIHPPLDADLRRRFHHLATEWREDTRFMSSIHDMVSHPAYLQIIGMGKDALPLLLEELHRQPDHWFVALQAITGINPIPPSASGDVEAMAQAWLNWGKQSGI